VINLHTVSSGS